MTDLEMIKKCAEKMGLNHRVGILQGTIERVFYWNDNVERVYDPLHDDAQAMALLFLLMLEGEVIINSDEFRFNSDLNGIEAVHSVVSQQDLNRAIVECVSKLV